MRFISFPFLHTVKLTFQLPSLKSQDTSETW